MSHSPFAGVHSRLPVVPLAGKLLLLASVTIALLAAILASYADESLVLPIVAAGVVIGLVLAVIVTLRNRS